MRDFKVDFIGEVEMVGNDPHPPVLTAAVRPNFVISENYCLCYIVETDPPEGIPFQGKGTFRAHVICLEENVPLFAVGSEFELRAARRVFAKGSFREIISIAEAKPAST